MMEENKKEMVSNYEKDGVRNYDEEVKTTKEIRSFEETIDLMLSSDWKERFIAEYAQAKIRYNHLHNFIIKFESGTLEHPEEYVSNLFQFKNQKQALGQYIYSMEIRAEVENIPLPTII